MSTRSRAIKAGYRSGFEDDTAKYLKKKGIKFTYEKERITWLDVKTRHYKPDFILVSAGFDAHKDDPLAALNLTEHAYRVLTSELKKLANMFSEGRIISMLEGGYDLKALSSSVLEHLRIFQSED